MDTNTNATASSSGQDEENRGQKKAEVQESLENATREELETRLIQSCCDGSRDMVDFLLSHGVHVDARREDGRTGLILSSMCGHENIVALVLQHGADVNICDESDMTALMCACMNGHNSVVELLIQNGASVNGCDSNEHLVTCFIEEDGDDVSNESESGDRKETPLMLACRKGHAITVKTLLECGADVNHSGRANGDTALMLACEFGHDKVVKLLIDFRADLELYRFDGKTALNVSCETDQENMVRLLVENGAKVDGGDHFGPTGLLRASGCGHERIVELLLGYGADVNRQDRFLRMGDTALISACKFGQDSIVELLVQAGAELNAHDDSGRTGLIYACQSGHKRVVEILLDHGVSVNHCVDDHDTKKAALLCGCRYGQQKVTEMEPTSYVCQYICKRRTPLMSACSNKHQSVVALLLEHGADVNGSDMDEKTALMFSCGYTSLCCDDDKDLCQERCGKIIEMLLQHGACIDAQAKSGMTALMFAAKTCHKLCLEKLLSARANLDLSDTERYTVFSHAMKNKNTECLRILLEEGQLLKDGRLKPLHKHLDKSYISVKALFLTIELGVFEWEFCPYYHLKPVSLAALDSGYCPGKLNCVFVYDLKVSPLILSLLSDHTDLTKTILEILYFFPEDYRRLCTDSDIRERITNNDLLDEITLQPMSLFAWSFITVSKCLSVSGHPGKRWKRVDSLPIPTRLKTALMFRKTKSIS